MRIPSKNTNLTDMTMKHIYQNLIIDLCAAVDLANVDAILNSATFEVDDVGVSLRYDKGSPDIMLVYVDFGPVPGKDNGAIYHKLLEQNFITAIGSTGSFTMAPATKRIVHISALELDKTTVGSLVGHLGHMSKLAREWRTTHYIDDEAAPAPQQRDTHSSKLNANRSA
jgi:hypothetical protein